MYIWEWAQKPSHINSKHFFYIQGNVWRKNDLQEAAWTSPDVDLLLTLNRNILFLIAEVNDKSQFVFLLLITL